MKSNQIFNSAALFFFLFISAGAAEAKVILPSIFTDNMVLQQRADVAFWGKTTPGKTVVITPQWSKKGYPAKADQEGNWKVKIATPAYGGPYQINLNDGEAIILSNVMVGEVWICSGQSNMEMPLAGWGKIDNYKNEIADAKYDNIRLFQVEHITSNVPLTNAAVANNGWTPCTPQTVAEFSSTAYFFAREIYKKTGIPIGLIHTSWGGTIAEAWTSATTIKGMPDFAAALNRVSGDPAAPTYAQELSKWQNLVATKDAGKGTGKTGWLAAATDDAGWGNMALPTFWEQSALPDFDGIVYFRKKITIPKSWEGKSITVTLGMIDDNDITFFNGQQIGTTEGYNNARTYTIPAEQVKSGESVIAVRVFDGGGGGGMYGDKDVMALTSASGEKISLVGTWKYKIGLNFKDVPAMPASNDGPNRPTVLYNAMINPFIPYTIRGAIWYQGESNADRANQYRTLFPAMIKDWRSKWNIGDFPFYFVQLANYMQKVAEPAPSAWAELRDAQRQTLSLHNTGMAVTIDIGNTEDIHPKNKQEVGRRLALIALAKTYGNTTAYTGPEFIAQKIKGNTILLNFKHIDGGLNAKDGDLKGFAIAGADQKFYWAKATIQGDHITVSSANVPNPVAVRYAWASNPEANLYNGAGLPASPFRTDNWKDSTFGRK